jgi:hypothetical protein
MDLEILKKKISTFRTDGGHVRGVSDELLLEVLHAWEQWVGSGSEFARSIGVDRNAVPKFIGKAKKLKREGFPTGDFKEIKLDGPGTSASAIGPCTVIELGFPDGKVIRFPLVDQLVEFLKKAA